MKINVAKGQFLTFSEIPAEYGTEGCKAEFRGQVESVDVEQNIVEVLVQIRCLCNEANCPYNPHDAWYAWYSIFFMLDDSTWDLNGEWKRECQDPQWIDPEMES